MMHFDDNSNLVCTWGNLVVLLPIHILYSFQKHMLMQSEWANLWINLFPLHKHLNLKIYLFFLLGLHALEFDTFLNWSNTWLLVYLDVKFNFPAYLVNTCSIICHMFGIHQNSIVHILTFCSSTCMISGRNW